MIIRVGIIDKDLDKWRSILSNCRPLGDDNNWFDLGEYADVVLIEEGQAVANYSPRIQIGGPERFGAMLWYPFGVPREVRDEDIMDWLMENIKAVAGGKYDKEMIHKALVL